VVWIESGIYAQNAKKTVGQQAGAEEQNRGQAILQDGERAVRKPQAGHGRFPVALFERRVQIELRARQGGCQAKKQAGKKGNAKGECENVPVQMISVKRGKSSVL